MGDQARADDILARISTCDGTTCSQEDRAWLRDYVRGLRERVLLTDLLREVGHVAAECAEVSTRGVTALDRLAAAEESRVALASREAETSADRWSTLKAGASRVLSHPATNLALGALALWLASWLGVLDHIPLLGTP